MYSKCCSLGQPLESVFGVCPEKTHAKADRFTQKCLKKGVSPSLVDIKHMVSGKTDSD